MSDHVPHCLGCGTRAPNPGRGGYSPHGWHQRQTSAVSPAVEPGEEERRYVISELACPRCFAEFGWYEPAGV